MLKYFKIDRKRDRLVVDVEFYQMYLHGAVEVAKALYNSDFLPGWSKFAEAPPKGKGFFVCMLEAVFLGKHGLDELSTGIQFEEYDNREQVDVRVAAMFLPKIRNDMLKMAASYAQEALPGFVVAPIYGNTTTNKKSERYARDIIEKARKEGKSVLFLASYMMQRSFSIPEITELYLAYDAGQEAATIQKMSRALTPWHEGKIGKIVSLSFDPQRDDKFDSIIIQTVQNYKRNHDIKSAKEAMRDVLRTIDIFNCTANGPVKVEVDEYLKQIQDRKSLSRVIGKVADISKLSPEAIEALAKGNADYFRNKAGEAVERGRTRDNTNKPKQPKKKPENLSEKEWIKLIQEARKVITIIVENMDILVVGTKCATVHDALIRIEQEPKWQEMLANHFEVDFSVIQYLFSSGTIQEDLVQLMWDK